MGNVSAVVVNYNAGAELHRCLTAITLDVAEIIVVDNQSSDGSQDNLSQRFNKLTLLQNKKNIGFGAAVNQAITVCKPNNHILIINPDCELHAGALKSLVDSLQINQKIGLVAPLVLDKNGKEQSGSRRHLPAPWRLIQYACGIRGAIDLRGAPVPDAGHEYPAVSGACMLIRRCAWDVIGGMDERFFLHFEDLDLMRNLHIAGYINSIQPHAKAIHVGGASSSKTPLKVLWHKHFSLQKYLFKHHRYHVLTWTVLPIINIAHLFFNGLRLWIRR